MTNPTITSFLNDEHTKEEVFNFVKTKLIEQGKPSKSGGLCFYRHDDGCKCAIGHLIPDDQYDPTIEGIDVIGLLRSGCWFSKYGQFQAKKMLFLRKLQSLHDQAPVNRFVNYIKASTIPYYE